MNGSRPTLTIRAYALMIVAAITLAGCRSAPPAEEDNAAEDVVIRMAVSGARVTIKAISSPVRLLGETVARRHVSLRAPAGGRVIGLNILTGDHVKRGQVVAHIISREVEAAANGLAIVRQVDPEEAPSLNYSLKRYTHGAGVPVTAPDDAIVAQRMVSPGQVVAEFDQLADLIDPRSVFINAAVPADELASISPGMEAIIRSPLYPGVNFPARVVGLSPSFNQGGITSAARLEFSGVHRINEAGAPVEAIVTLEAARDAIVIPANALFENAATDSYYVFVARNDGRAHRQTVIIGIRSEHEVQISSGVQAGQIVITSGGYALSDGLQVSVHVVPNGH